MTLQIGETGYSPDTDDDTDGDQLSGILNGDNPSFTAAITVVARDAANQVVSSVSEDGDVELTVSVDRGRGHTGATGEALSVALSLAPSDPAQASTYRLAPARVALPAVTPDGMQSAATTGAARRRFSTSSSTTTGSF